MSMSSSAIDILTVFHVELSRLTTTERARLNLLSEHELAMTIRTALTQAIAIPDESTPLQKLLAVRSQPKRRTLQMLALLESRVQGFTKLSLVDASMLIETDLGHRISPQSLRITLLRSADHHYLAVRANQIQLRGDVLIERTPRPRLGGLRALPMRSTSMPSMPSTTHANYH